MKTVKQTTEPLVGKQESGSSEMYTKEMALAAIRYAKVNTNDLIAADVGGGAGQFARIIESKFKQISLLDYAPPAQSDLPKNISSYPVDLNERWPLPDAAVDFSFAIEVIEHVENPRHFFRELKRITKPGGFIYLSTPNNHSVSSKLTFVFRNHHRYFQDACYPAHISAILECDLRRMAMENSLEILRYVWSNFDTIPLLHSRIPFLRGRLFSDSIGILLKN